MYKFKHLSGIDFVFSTVKDKNMDFRFGKRKEVLKNRKSFFKKLNIPLEKCVFLSVLHNDKVVSVGKKDFKRGVYSIKDAVKADGLIVNKKGIYLCLLVADCLPIVIYEKKKFILSLIHAGWKGLDKNIVKKAVLMFKKSFKSDPRDLIVIIGPGIRKESYFFKSVKQKDDKNWKDFIKKKKKDLYSVDLVGFVKYQFINTGILEKNIFDLKVDTAKSKEFYSHFRDKNNSDKQGRFICVAFMK